MNATSQPGSIRPEWLDTQREEPLEPGLVIVDAHHHLYHRPGARYLLDEMLDDLDCGHNVAATVLVQARAMLRAEGPEFMKPIGETEFANGVAAMSASGIYGPTRVCAALVGFADLRLGDAIRPVLEAHIAAGGGTVDAGGRFRGIRQGAAWDPDTSLLNAAYTTSEGMLASPEFGRGFAQLAPMGLSFDAWLFFHQIPRLTALARKFPDTAIVLDHCGGVLRIGRYAASSADVFRQWKVALIELATCANVSVKLGGLGQWLSGFDFQAQDRAPSSTQLAQAWRPWIETCVEAFGTARCMVESNFPVDKANHSYGIGWNALKRLFRDASPDEKADVFWRSAARFYRLWHVGELSALRPSTT
ncbi:amidohydrolase family protein [Variovorax guangxiensis]|uniref:amidohydrolase family protein n=1 Tax=Variovorax guangxiensis TaxID=1775474 RepID=UPI002861F4F8|nr:amidohydrolase family protein [Variovorax guangxiensis]MDR6861541.1 putative TIM-barrel fold metal-dependent hydrolase [Variovorax guangxiensis]